MDFGFIFNSKFNIKLSLSSFKNNDHSKKSTERKKNTPHIMITKQDFTKKDEFEENYEDLDKLGEVLII